MLDEFVMKFDQVDLSNILNSSLSSKSTTSSPVKRYKLSSFTKATPKSVSQAASRWLIPLFGKVFSKNSKS